MTLYKEGDSPYTVITRTLKPGQAEISPKRTELLASDGRPGGKARENTVAEALRWPSADND